MKRDSLTAKDFHNVAEDYADDPHGPTQALVMSQLSISRSLLDIVELLKAQTQPRP
jgi:hypothetical protein